MVLWLQIYGGFYCCNVYLVCLYRHWELLHLLFLFSTSTDLPFNVLWKRLQSYCTTILLYHPSSHRESGTSFTEIGIIPACMSLCTAGFTSLVVFYFYIQMSSFNIINRSSASFACILRATRRTGERCRTKSLNHCCVELSVVCKRF